MEHEKCYVYDGKTASRPAKKRRIEKYGLDASLELRKRAFSEIWRLQEEQINEVVRETTASTLHQIWDFVVTSRDEIRLPAGLITSGTGSVTHAGLFKQLAEVIGNSEERVFIPVSASEATNLKILLKNVIAKVVKEDDDSDGENCTMEPQRRGPKLLNYDLQRLYDWCRPQKLQKIVIALQDTEAFDVLVLTDFLQLLNSWKDRIPILLLFGIATSVELFEDRLPRSALKCISGQRFEVQGAGDLVESVFVRSVSGEATRVRLGPALSDKILQRQRDYTQSVEVFADSLKYAYMCHFYGNPLSIFLCDGIAFQDVTASHFEALRNLPSFRSHAEALIEQKETQRVRALLSSDKDLFQEVINGIEASQSIISWTIGAIQVLQQMRTALGIKTAPPFSSTYIKALKGELTSSPILRELMLLIKRASSDTLDSLLPTIIDTLMTMPASNIDISPDDFRDVHDELFTLVEDNKSTQGPLRSEHDVRHNTLRTTVVAQKVELSKQKSKLSKNDTVYSDLVSRLHDLLEVYFSKTLSGVQNLFLHEILFYDLRASHTEVFTPRPRFAVERALSSPHDYLGCVCCANSQETLTASHPPTAIIYQLYLETGALVNTADLWTAFNTIAGEQYGDEETTLALFMRGLAELKYMGMIKQSRKKVDHLAKLMWRGL